MYIQNVRNVKVQNVGRIPHDDLYKLFTKYIDDVRQNNVLTISQLLTPLYFANRSRNMSDTEDHDTSQQPLVSKDGEVKDKPPDQHPGSPNEADGDIVDTEDGEIDSLVDIECQMESTVDLSMYRNKPGMKKYRNSVRYLLPIRFEKSPKDEIPEGTAGLFSLLTYAWLTPIIWRLYKKGEGFLEHMRCSDIDRAEVNGERVEKLWLEELSNKGPEKASFARVIFKAVRTRVLISALTIILSVTFSFAAPAFVMRELLSNLSHGQMSFGYGMGLVVAISGMEFCRTMLFAIGWVINYKTGIRMRGGALSLLYQKILRLRGLKDKTIGELVNICSNDGQRLFDACAIGPLLFGGPIVLLYGTVYSAFLIGPWALVGSATFIGFYPFMAFISKLTTRLRRKCIAITDQRVQRMTELLNCIKLIKMYAWEKPFAKKIADIRKHEKGFLEKTAFVQSVSQSMAPMVPVLSGIFVITAHVMTGNDITATQAFTLLAMFNAMRFSLGVIPFAIRALSEVRVTLDRCKAFILIAIFHAMRHPLATVPTLVHFFANSFVSAERIKVFTLIAICNVMKMSIGQIPGAVRILSDLRVSATRFKAFVFIAIYNSMKRSIAQAAKLVRTFSEVSVSSERIKSVLMMEEMNPYPTRINNPNHMVVMRNATFSWDMDQKDIEITKDGTLDIEIKVNVPNGKDMASNHSIDEKQKLQGDTDDSPVSPTLEPALQDIDFTLEKGKIIGVCGSVGSGKSSFISSILGRMNLVSGKIGVSGSLAYVSQQAWIMNATVKDNILFGQLYDETRYNAVIHACCLQEDMESFVSGSETEIGERGINLSGGQKQRISLARALYADKDVYLLDDPLSAVDIHVGRHIFTEYLTKALKGKTVLFVTHQLQYLSQCDGIIVLTNGRITERGKHSELMAKNGEYSNLITTYYTQNDSEVEQGGLIERVNSIHGSPQSETCMRRRTFSSTSQRSGSSKPGFHQQASVMSATSEKDDLKKAGRLMVTEEIGQGQVTSKTYWDYVKAAGGVFVSSIVIIMFILNIGVQTASSWWLSYWLDQGGGNITIPAGNMSNSTNVTTVTVMSKNIRDNPDMEFYVQIYGFSVIAIVILMLLRAVIFMKVTLRASSKMHDNIFSKVLACPMKFFDTTPIGRIINRFAADMDEIDVRLPGNMEIFLQNILLIIFALISISYVSLWFLIALVPLTFFFVLLNVLFTSCIRQLKRLDSTTRSPLLSHVQASVQGISTIHAFGKSQDFVNKFHQLLDTNTVPYFLFCSSNRWLAVRLDIISVTVITVTGLLVIVNYESMTPAMAGMALAFAIQMTGLFQFSIRMAIETQARFTSVERLNYYSREVESEGETVVKDNRPHGDWPSDGSITFRKYKMRYRENLPLALNSVSFDVLPREKIGIVGRSGSGKSSLGMALFRLVEAYSGSISIDNIDVSTIGLHDLRSKLSIIPQDPVLFVGTIRYNLDPFQEYKDSDLWDALEKCHIKDTIAGLDMQLDSSVVENGENFSVGERQLMCLARALLRHSKILILDEATAAIDTETDSFVQTTIKEAFDDCTMLIIAHRLNTVLGCNRILVMEDGRVVEYDSPSVLTANPKSKFKMMLDAVESQQGML